MALTKERKNDLVAQYETWLKESEALVLTEYTGLSMAAIDELRREIRETGGEFHIVKNTLGRLAFESAALDVPADYLIGSTAIGLAFEDPPGLAKAIVDFGKNNDAIKIKGGFLGEQLISAEEIIALAKLPPLPVVQGQLLATIMAPASQLTRLLAEPGRQLAQVIKSYSEIDAAQAAAS